MSLPWFMGDWLALDGLVSPAALPLFAGSVVMAAMVCVLARRSPRARAPLTAVCYASCAALTVGAHGAYAHDRSSLLALSPTYIRSGMIEGWDWVQHHVEHATIANTGNNLPYPLFGEHLSNQVAYVNIDRHAEWRLHDYARVRGRAGATTSRDLAQPSGQLMPLGQSRRASEASRPRYERWEGNADAWLRNLRSAKVTHLFVSVLSAYEIEYVWHNSEGFPVEDEWARTDPRDFTLLFENGQVRVYSLAGQRGPLDTAP